MKASALWVLHEALRRRSFWRPAIDALKVSVSLNPTAEAQETLDKLVAEHGFRITEYKVDADAAQPRLCIEFSSAWAWHGMAQYFKVTARTSGPKERDRQICPTAQHGQRSRCGERGLAVDHAARPE